MDVALTLDVGLGRPHFPKRPAYCREGAKFRKCSEQVGPRPARGRVNLELIGKIGYEDCEFP